MRLISMICERVKRNGFLMTFQYCIQKLIGVHKLQQQLDTAYYFLNQYVDITQFPAAKDQDLRILQKCDVALMRVFDVICRKYNLTYWLDYGTLLGAVRHNGFIPWDDDTDISMPRADYDKLKNEISHVFLEHGIEFSIERDRIGIAYQHLKTGIWIDVFPVDTIYCNGHPSLYKQELNSIYNRFRKEFIHNKQKQMTNPDAISKYFNSFSKGLVPVSLISVDFSGNDKLYAVEQDSIYPLGCHTFEGFVFPVPNNYNDYLSELYGKDYMSLPRSGILQHGEATGRLPLSAWAKVHQVDMFKVESDLITIADLLSN